jgi:hypothetical protein
MLLLFVFVYNVMFFSYFFLEITKPVQELRKKVHVSKNVVIDVARSLKIPTQDVDEKKIAQLVKKKFNTLYRM